MVRLSTEFYSAAGIRAAIDALEDFGAFRWDESAKDGYFDIEVEAAEDVDGSELEGEFANFALARSVEAARASDAA